MLDKEEDLMLAKEAELEQRLRADRPWWNPEKGKAKKGKGQGKGKDAGKDGK